MYPLSGLACVLRMNPCKNIIPFLYHTLNKLTRMKNIVKNEEHSEPGKYMNLEEENIEIEQQINSEENKVSESEVKEMEPVEDASPEELNQIKNEDVKEQEQVPITILSKEEERSLSDETRVHTTNEARVHTKQDIHI